MTRGYNETPDNFQVPSDDTIQRVIEFADWQIELDNSALMGSEIAFSEASTELKATPPGQVAGSNNVSSKMEVDHESAKAAEMLKDPFMK